MVVALLILSLTMAACDSGANATAPTRGVKAPTQPVAEVTSTTDVTLPRTVPGSSTSLTPPNPQPIDMPMADKLLPWSVLLGPSEALSPPAQFDGQWLARIEALRGLIVSDTAGDEVVVHDLPTGDSEWFLDHVYLDSGRVVFVEHEGRLGDYRIHVYEVATGEGRLVEEWGGAPERHLVPQLALSGDWLAWNTTLDSGQSCIKVENLASGERFDAVCAVDQSRTLTWPSLRWPVLSYREQPAGPFDQDDEVCFNLNSVVLPDGDPLRHGQRECWGYQIVADEEALVFFESKPFEGDVFRSPIYGVGSDGVVHALGRGELGSATVCDGRAYWTTVTADNSEIRTWRPGDPAVSIVYRSPEDKYPTTQPECVNGWLTIARAFTGVGPSTDEVLVATTALLDGEV